MARVRSAIEPSGNFNPRKVLPSVGGEIPTSKAVAAVAGIPQDVWV
jgi:hypothetical protein